MTRGTPPATDGVPRIRTACDFYTPKDSSRGQLLEAKDNLQKMPANIPLTDDERAAVDDGQAALDQLLARLTDVPTPAGPTPRQLGIPATGTLLPVVEVRHSKQSAGSHEEPFTTGGTN